MSIKKLSLFFLLSAISISASATPRTGRYFDRAVFVVFENTNYSDAIAQPFFKSLASKGANFSNFFALTHPSQGNYIALTSGDLNGVTNDNPHDVNVYSVVDLLEAKGLTWKVYAENYPGNCFTGKSSGSYVRKHNPFISYLNIQKNSARCANIVEASQFDQDAARGALPNYVFYVPNSKNDGHDTGVAYADSWYAQKFSKYFSNTQFMQDTVVITTFDESGFSAKNQIYTSILGPAVRPGSYGDSLTIPSLLKLIEDNWGLGNLGKQDVSSNPVPNIWQ